MIIKRFLISWIVSSLLMFSLSYFWHGIFLNDFERINYPMEIFLTLFALVYWFIGLGLTVMYSYIDIKFKSVSKGIIIGMGLGFLVYLIAFVLGVTFYASPKLNYILLDFTWQAIEQGIGGLSIGYVFFYFKKRSMYFVPNE